MGAFIDMHREDAVKEWSINKVEVRMKPHVVCSLGMALTGKILIHNFF